MLKSNNPTGIKGRWKGLRWSCKVVPRHPESYCLGEWLCLYDDWQISRPSRPLDKLCTWTLAPWYRHCIVEMEPIPVLVLKALRWLYMSMSIIQTMVLTQITHIRRYLNPAGYPSRTTLIHNEFEKSYIAIKYDSFRQHVPSIRAHTPAYK